jgi:hypothetical protein
LVQGIALWCNLPFRCKAGHLAQNWNLF